MQLVIKRVLTLPSIIICKLSFLQSQMAELVDAIHWRVGVKNRVESSNLSLGANNNIMGKTILHFFDQILTARVGRPGVTVNENTGEPEQTIDEPRIAPSGYYVSVNVGDDTHVYYRGIGWYPTSNSNNVQFRNAWELTTEEVFEY